MKGQDQAKPGRRLLYKVFRVRVQVPWIYIEKKEEREDGEGQPSGHGSAQSIQSIAFRIRYGKTKES